MRLLHVFPVCYMDSHSKDILLFLNTVYFQRTYINDIISMIFKNTCKEFVVFISNQIA